MPRRRNRSHSSVQALPDEIRAAVDGLLMNGRHTLDEIVAYLETRGAAVSRSALGRYARQQDALAADIRLTREMARAIGSELGELSDGDDAVPLIVESLNALLLQARLQIGAGGEDERIKPGDLALLARAARDLQSALRSRVDTDDKIRRRLAGDVARQAIAAAGEVERMACEQGLSAATAAALRQKVLGVRVPPREG